MQRDVPEYWRTVFGITKRQVRNFDFAREFSRVSLGLINFWLRFDDRNQPFKERYNDHKLERRSGESQKRRKDIGKEGVESNEFTGGHLEGFTIFCGLVFEPGIHAENDCGTNNREDLIKDIRHVRQPACGKGRSFLFREFSRPLA